MLEALEVAAADHTGQMKKTQKAPKILAFKTLPSEGFRLGAPLLQGEGDPTG